MGRDGCTSSWTGNEFSRAVRIAASTCRHHQQPCGGDAPPFADRQDAGRRLAARLGGRRRRAPLVLGIPRGGVPVARAVARALRCEWDVVLAQKLSAPHCPECALGAVTPGGHVFPRGCTCPCGNERRWDGFLEVLESRWRMLVMRAALYDLMRKPRPIAGRDVIVVDDGAVSGATLAAALNVLRDARPARLTAALPVAGGAALRLALRLADDVVVLERSAAPPALAAWYGEFPAIMDEDVACWLGKSATAPPLRRVPARALALAFPAPAPLRRARGRFEARRRTAAPA